MRLVTFASGSSGNCAMIAAGDSRILIDAGISQKRICQALAELGLSPSDLNGVFITHEHSDHISGLSMLTKRFGLPVYAPRTVASRLSGLLPEVEDCLRVIHTSEPLPLGDMSVTAFHTSHDTPESAGYRAESAEGSVGVCTDLGVVTEEVRETLWGVDAALIETNHDIDMLRYGPYPVYLKRRILSDHGHLSNEAGAELAEHLAAGGARSLLLGHLSRENNSPEAAFSAVASALRRGGERVDVRVAPPLGTVSVEVLRRCSV